MTSAAADPAHAELMSVGPSEVVVTFTSEPGVDVHHAGRRPRGHHAPGRSTSRASTGLAPDTEYDLAVEGVAPDCWLPPSVRTLVQPPGELVATIATANDVHFGETDCGLTGDPATDAIGPILAVASRASRRTPT